MKSAVRWAVGLTPGLRYDLFEEDIGCQWLCRQHLIIKQNMSASWRRVRLNILVRLRAVSQGFGTDMFSKYFAYSVGKR